MSDYKMLRAHAEERLRLIEENVRDYAMFVVDVDGRIASWNRGAERILGYSEVEALEMNCASIFTPEDRAQGAVEYERSTAAATGRAEDERWHLRKDGTRFWGSGVMTALRGASGDLLGFVKILRDETQRKEAEQDRAAAHEMRIQQERQNAVLNERNRIAQEIHDTLAQSFTAISLQLEAAKDHMPEGTAEALEHIERAQELARMGLTEARRSVWALRPQILEHDSLVGAFTRVAEETRAARGVAVSLAIEGLPTAVSPLVEDHLLRIGQEGVTNALRHAGPAKIRLVLCYGAASVSLRVEDDGKGFSPNEVAQGYGLTFMRERTGTLGGQWELSSAPGSGTKVQVTVPLTPDGA